MKIEHLSEPRLVFGGGNEHICPRKGIATYGVFDRDNTSRRQIINIGGVGCVFQSKVATDSRRKLPPIPREGCHPFQSKAATLNPGI